MRLDARLRRLERHAARNGRCTACGGEQRVVRLWGREEPDPEVCPVCRWPQVIRIVDVDMPMPSFRRDWAEPGETCGRDARESLHACEPPHERDGPEVHGRDLSSDEPPPG